MKYSTEYGLYSPRSADCCVLGRHGGHRYLDNRLLSVRRYHARRDDGVCLWLCDRRTPTDARKHEVKEFNETLWYCSLYPPLSTYLRLYFFYIFLLASPARLRPARHRASRRRGQLACSRPDLRETKKRLAFSLAFLAARRRCTCRLRSSAAAAARPRSRCW